MGDNMRLNKKTIISLALCLGAMFMAVGYSILMSELKINGSANISSTWDVHIRDIDEVNRTGSAYNIEEPSHTANTAKFNVSLVNPGDSISFGVVIENSGTIPAVLNGMNVSQSGTDAISYSVSGLADGDVIYPDDEVYLYIDVEYNSSVIADPYERVKKLKVDLDWVQYTNQEISEG